MKKIILILSLLFTLFSTLSISAQPAYKIRVISAESMGRTQYMPEGVTSFRGHPVFEHDGAYLYCDSAWLNEITNTVDCYGSVRIKSSDTLNLYGKVLHYDGNTKIASISQDVRLIDNQTTLYTDFLVFDRNTQIASYTTGGRIVNQDNFLSSRRGYYHTNTKLMKFKGEVLMTNPDYKVTCDSLNYNTQTRISYFICPTKIKGKDNEMYCKSGQYNRVTEQSEFAQRALIVDEGRTLTGDSLYFENKTGYGRAVNNIIMTDTAQDLIVKGNLAHYFKKEGFVRVMDKAVAMQGDEDDTLFLHADTLKAVFDTTTNDIKQLYGWKNTRFFKNDIQGVCDSLYFNYPDSVIKLYGFPILWSEENQLTADTIIIYTGNKSVKELHMYSNAIMSSNDSLEYFNQVKGKTMKGYFQDNELKIVDVEGNAESVYFIREDDKSLIGVNKTQGRKMKIYVENKKIHFLTYFEKSNGNMYPEQNFTDEILRLKGFEWYIDQRPKDRNDVLRNTRN